MIGYLFISEFTSQTIRETQRFTIRSVVDPRTGTDVSIYQAIADGIVDQNRGIYVNPLTGDSMHIQEAMDSGRIAVDYINRYIYL